MSLKYSFAGKKVLITGGTQGVGLALVKRFHDEGALVHTFARSQEKVDKLRRELPNVRVEVGDVTDWEVTKEIVQKFGVMDHLVNNAAVLDHQKFLEITKECATKTFEVNVLGTVNVTQAVAKGMIEAGREGSVVNISSTTSRIGLAGMSMYAASKAALENLTKSMALELGEHNIRVNAITLGMVDTPMLADIPEAFAEQINKAIEDWMRMRLIKKRKMQPEEVADLVMFLLSPASGGMITGESVALDGGSLAI